MVPRMNLRPGHSKDAVAIGDVWFDSWMSTKPTNPIVTNADLVKRAYNELAGRWEVTIVEADHKVIGFLAVAPAEQRLDQLYVAPSAQRRGIGAELLTVAKRRFPGGFWLKVDGRNERARKFYEREGLTLARTEIEDGRERMIYSFEP
jgi:ribosomal protein S18 acetylase RimI-like enzyme